VNEHAEGDASGAAPRHLLAQDDARQEIGAATPVLRREFEPEESEGAQPSPEFARDAVLPGLDPRRHLLLDEGADGLPEQLVLVRERSRRHGGAAS